MRHKYWNNQDPLVNARPSQNSVCFQNPYERPHLGCEWPRDFRGACGCNMMCMPDALSPCSLVVTVQRTQFSISVLFNSSDQRRRRYVIVNTEDAARCVPSCTHVVAHSLMRLSLTLPQTMVSERLLAVCLPAQEKRATHFPDHPICLCS